MLYIPLMLLGAERSIQNRRKGVLCAAVFGFALSGFYYLYIGSVSLAVYVIYRLIRQNGTFRSALVKIVSLIAEYLLGIGLSAVWFLPAVTGFFLSGRGEHPQLKLWMSQSEILHMLTNMFLPSYGGMQALSVCTIGMIDIVCVMFDRNKKREKVILALLFLSAIVPYVSYVMAGFGAVYDRWELVLDMYLAFLVVDMFDGLGAITICQKTAVGVVFFILYLFGKKHGLLDDDFFTATLRAYARLLLALIIIAPVLKASVKKFPKIGTCVLLAVVVLTIRSN